MRAHFIAAPRVTNALCLFPDPATVRTTATGAESIPNTSATALPVWLPIRFPFTFRATNMYIIHSIYPPTLKRAFYPKRLKGLDKIYLSKYQHFQYNVKLAQAFECKDKKEHLSLLSLGLGFFFPFAASVSTFRHLVRNRTLFKSILSITASLSNACVWHLAWNYLSK